MAEYTGPFYCFKMAYDVLREFQYEGYPCTAEHLLWSEFSEMVRIRTILQISVRIRSEFAQKVRIFQFLSLSLPKNLEKEDLA